MLLAVFSLPQAVWAIGTDPCEGIAPIYYNDASEISRAFEDISLGRNLASYRSANAAEYRLCFAKAPEIYSAVVTPISAFTLTNNTGLPVVVSGLNLKGDWEGARLLKLRGENPITLRNSSFSFCTQCIDVGGRGMVIGPAVSVGPFLCGTGILMCGSDHRILESSFDRCSVSVQIGSEECHGDNIEVGEGNSFSYGGVLNLFGITPIDLKIVNGTGNKFLNNNISETLESPDGQEIILSPQGNGGMLPPVVLSIGGQNIGENPRSALTYAAGVDAFLRVKSPYNQGKLDIYLMGERVYPGDRFKVINRHVEAVSVASQPDPNGGFILKYRFPVNSGLMCKRAVALFHHPSLGSAGFSKIFYLNPPLSGNGEADDYHCSGGPPSEIVPPLCDGANLVRVGSFSDITRAFSDISGRNNLNRYLSPDGSKYLLCFEVPERQQAIPVSYTIPLQNNTGKPVVVSGLKISANRGSTDTLVKLSGADPIIVEKSSFQACPYCILVASKGTRIENNVLVNCTGRGRSVGITLLGEGHRIENTAIGGCDVGVQIGSGNQSGKDISIGPENPRDYRNKKVAFFRNKTAIKVENGSGNYFQYNSVERAQSEHPENFSYVKNTTEKLKKPIMLPKEGADYHGSDILEYPEGAVLPQDGSEVTATFKIISDYNEGKLEILTSPVLYNYGSFAFYREARFVSSRQKGEQYILTYALPMALDMSCKAGIAVFHHPNMGTSDNTSELFYLNGPHKEGVPKFGCEPVPSGLIAAPSLDDPGLQQGGASSLPPILDENDDKKGGEEMTASLSFLGESQSFGEGSGTGSVSIGDAVKMGCSLHPNVDRSAKAVDLLWLLLPLGFLVRFRRYLRHLQ
ncbi:MAG: hypothetical protein Q7T03_05605 [Deltaproteobacteria bacterium]|nr:hypothetical protein [Deltaproteobacteria bacterium]